MKMQKNDINFALKMNNMMREPPKSRRVGAKKTAKNFIHLCTGQKNNDRDSRAEKRVRYLIKMTPSRSPAMDCWLIQRRGTRYAHSKSTHTFGA